jgi:hypothetical protein
MNLMPNVTVTVNHRLSRDGAIRRVRATIASALTQYGSRLQDFRENWDGGYLGFFSASAKGQQATGTVSVNPSDVTVQIELPLIAFGMKGRVEATLRRALVATLA